MVLTWMSATRNLAKKLMRALFQATLLASVRSKRRMSAIVFCPFKIHLVMNLLRITARWPFMHLQRSIFVLYLVPIYEILSAIPSDYSGRNLGHKRSYTTQTQITLLQV